MQGVQDDIKTLQKNMDNINHIYRGLSLHIEPTFGKKLADEVQELNTNWDKVLTLAEQQHARLKGSLDSSEEIYNKIERIINWLGPIKEDLSNKDYAVESLNDLVVKAKKFKVRSVKIDSIFHCVKHVHLFYLENIPCMGKKRNQKFDKSCQNFTEDKE